MAKNYETVIKVTLKFETESVDLARSTTSAIARNILNTYQPLVLTLDNTNCKVRVKSVDIVKS